MLKKGLVSLAMVMLFGTSAIAGSQNGSKNPVVMMETTLGNVKLELYQKEAPISVKNFLDYVKKGYYENTIFHRVIPGFMIQGGGLTKDMKPKEGSAPAIKNEATNGLKNDRGTIAMARTGEVNSATSQFFINVADNFPLNHTNESPQGFGYAVFGRVIEGMDVVDKIVNAPQRPLNRVFTNVPVTPVVIKSMKILK